jgi:hypothetical protein
MDAGRGGGGGGPARVERKEIMLAILERLSNAQLAAMFNAVTGQKVKRFDNIVNGRRRVVQVLEETNTEVTDALELAGVHGLNGQDRTVEAAPAEPVEAAPVEAAPVEEAEEPKLKRDKHGFVRRVREPKETKAPKRESRLEQVLGLLRRKEGATIVEVQEATGWLPHTTRAYLSKGGAAGKAATIMVSKEERGDRKVTVYRVR